MNIRNLIVVVASSLLLAAPLAAENLTFKDVVKKVEADVSAKTVKRGEAVTWTLTIELIDGWHTYPVKQADANAEPYVNKFKFPKSGEVVFVGELVEPKGVEKMEDGAKIVMIEGAGVWKRTLVIHPDAKPGKLTIKVPVVIMACANRCLPPETIALETEIVVSDAPAVAVDPKYQKEVAGAKK